MNPTSISFSRKEALTNAIRSSQWPLAQSLAIGLLSMSPEDTFGWKALGVSLHLQAVDGEARAPMERAVLLDPDDLEAHLNLGLFYQAIAALVGSKEAFTAALAIFPNSADLHANLAVTLHRLGDKEGAVDHCRSAILCHPQLAVAYANLGLLLGSMALSEEAMVVYQRAVCLIPTSLEARNNLALCLMESQRALAAIGWLRSVLILDPSHADACNNLSLVEKQRGRYSIARTLLEWALVIHPAFAAAFNNLSTLDHQAGAFEASAFWALKALMIQPEMADAYSNFGNALFGMGHPDQTLQVLRRAIQCDPSHANSYSNLAVVRYRQGELPEAVFSAQQALILAPDHAPTWSNLGVMMTSSNTPVSALAFTRRAVIIEPSSALAWTNDGVAHHEAGHYREALDAYDQAIALEPLDASAHCNRGQTHLLLGHLMQGWCDYEWRYRDALTQVRPREPQSRRFDPRQGFMGRTLLLHHEQGLGDTLQFSRYASRAADLGARVILEVQTPLKPLIMGMDPRLKVIGSEEECPPFDGHFSLLSLAGHFESQGEAPPQPGGYLKAPASRLEIWRQALGHRIKPRVGLCYFGHPGHSRDHLRSIPWQVFKAIVGEHQDFYLLQTQERPADAATIRDKPELHCPAIGDFEDTAALIQLMDVVISVDSCVAHLAGALNVPVWVLLQEVPDWRWLTQGRHTRWYASMRLFRKEGGSGWTNVLDAVQRALEVF